MSSLDKLIDRCNEMDITEQLNWLNDAIVPINAKKELDELRSKLRELHDTNAALAIYNRRIRLVVTLCVKAFDMLDLQGGLFIPPTVQDVIQKVRGQVALLENSLASSLEICERNIQ